MIISSSGMNIGTSAINIRNIRSVLLRGSVHPIKPFHFVGVLLCMLFWFATCGLCSIEWIQIPSAHDACGCYKDDNNVGPQDLFVDDVSSGQVQENSVIQLSLESVCTNLDMFCFPSTLSDFSPQKIDLEAATLEVPGSISDSSSDLGMFKLLDGRTMSCSLSSRAGVHDSAFLHSDNDNHNNCSCCRGPYVKQKDFDFKMSQRFESMGFPDDASFVDVEIKPPLLDWGQKYLHFPSLAFLTVTNRQRDRVLHVYEPFSTNNQFYPTNFSSELLLEPGQSASIGFVFLPRLVGLSSAHLVLQTSSGGFLVQAKGFAIDSPYGVQPLMGMDISSNGWWGKNLSLFNPFDEFLYVEEVTAWISFSLKNICETVDAKCTIENIWGYDEVGLLRAREWLDVNSGQVGFPVTIMRPYGNWVIGPRSSETLMEVDFSFDSEGKLFGVFCMQLRRSSQEVRDVVMIPLEAELDGPPAYDSSTASVLVSLDALGPCDASETVETLLSLRNNAFRLLSVISISEFADRKPFHIKYVKGLLLFPGSVTQVAVVTYNRKFEPDVNMNCKLLILTNESISPQIEIPCQDIIHSCSRYRPESSVRYEHQPNKFKPHNTRTGSLSSDKNFSAQNKKVLEIAEADEFVLGNWKSHGTGTGMSVLDDQEIVFPVVQVGTHLSRWISVRNPSQQPVVLQLILNSGEIIDECKVLNGLLHPPSSSNLVNHKSAPPKYGFSLGDSAQTEVYIHPYGTASFGPILFRPSNRCGWRSSALIRNNLSGVEWLSLRGFGGFHSLILLEGSDPVHSLEFNFSLPIPLDISPTDKSVMMEDGSYACFQPLSKTLYAKNTGDLPLEVKRIEVSGAECGLDGFMVHSCKRFFLEPGESTKLLISYRADFSAAIVHRDLEMALSTGILVMPMKASIPVYMLNRCKKSVFWMRVKKTLAAVLLAGTLILLVFWWIIPQVMAWSSQDYFFGGENSIASMKVAEKSSRSQQNQGNSKFYACNKREHLPSSVGEVEFLMMGMVNGYADHHAPQQGLTSKHAKPALGNQEHNNRLSGIQKEKAASSSLIGMDENSAVLEASESATLTVRIGKEKGRRRRRRKGAGAGLTALFDVSSSQSGNSTPSSPLSPLTSLTPNKICMPSSDVDQTVESRNPFTHVAGKCCDVSKGKVVEQEVSMNHSLVPTKEQSLTRRKVVSKPVLLPSATFPSTNRPAPSIMSAASFLTPSSMVAPHARAPGSKLCNEKRDHVKERSGVCEEYTYDIWGEHFSGLHLIGTSREAPAMMSSAKENDSCSFFVRGPQTLMANSQPRSVSEFHPEGK